VHAVCASDGCIVWEAWIIREYSSGLTLDGLAVKDERTR
jgi:hypothetical protein